MKLTRYACIQLGLFVVVLMGSFEGIVNHNTIHAGVFACIAGGVLASALWDCIPKEK